MSHESKMFGPVENKSLLAKEVSVSTALFVLGGSAVGAYVGFQIGSAIGAAVGALVGAFVGALAAGFIKSFRVKLTRMAGLRSSMRHGLPSKDSTQHA